MLELKEYVDYVNYNYKIFCHIDNCYSLLNLYEYFLAFFMLLSYVIIGKLFYRNYLCSN
jgi:hypothetical protein